MLNLFGINVTDAREKVFLSADAKKVLTPKKTMHSATFDGKELSITYRVGKEFEQIRDMLDNANNYPPEESFGFILSGEEVADRKDPERRSDEFMYAVYGRKNGSLCMVCLDLQSVDRSKTLRAYY